MENKTFKHIMGLTRSHLVSMLPVILVMVALVISTIYVANPQNFTRVFNSAREIVDTGGADECKKSGGKWNANSETCTMPRDAGSTDGGGSGGNPNGGGNSGGSGGRNMNSYEATECRRNDGKWDNGKKICIYPPAPTASSTPQPRPTDDGYCNAGEFYLKETKTCYPVGSEIQPGKTVCQDDTHNGKTYICDAPKPPAIGGGGGTGNGGDPTKPQIAHETCTFTGYGGQSVTIPAGESVAGGPEGVYVCNPDTGDLISCKEINADKEAHVNVTYYEDRYLDCTTPTIAPGNSDYTQNQGVGAYCKSGGILIPSGPRVVPGSSGYQQCTNGQLIPSANPYEVSNYLLNGGTPPTALIDACKAATQQGSCPNPNAFATTWLQTASPDIAAETTTKLAEQKAIAEQQAQAITNQYNQAILKKDIPTLQKMFTAGQITETQYQQAIAAIPPTTIEARENEAPPIQTTTQTPVATTLTPAPYWIKEKIPNAQPVLDANNQLQYVSGEIDYNPASLGTFSPQLSGFNMNTLTNNSLTPESGCGGSLQNCCRAGIDTFNSSNHSACNTGMACGTDGHCNYDTVLAKATAVIRLAEADPEKFETIIANNSQDPQVIASLNQAAAIVNPDQHDCTWTYSATAHGLICITDNVLEVYYNQPISTQYPNSGNLNQSCRIDIGNLNFQACNNDMLSCQGGTCLLTDQAKNNLATGNSQFNLTTINSAGAPLATNVALATSGCTQNGATYQQNGGCFRCLDTTINSVQLMPSMDYCTNSALAASLPKILTATIPVREGKGQLLTCHPSNLILIDNICVDPIAAAFAPGYNQGVVATAIRENPVVNVIPIVNFIVDHVVAPIFAAIPGSSYYLAAQDQAQVAEDMIANRPANVSSDDILGTISRAAKDYVHIDTLDDFTASGTVINNPNTSWIKTIISPVGALIPDSTIYKTLSYISLFTTAWTEGFAGPDQSAFQNYAETYADPNSTGLQKAGSATLFGLEMAITGGDIVSFVLAPFEKTLTAATANIPGMMTIRAVDQKVGYVLAIPLIIAGKAKLPVVKIANDLFTGIIDNLGDRFLGGLDNLAADIAPEVIEKQAVDIIPAVIEDAAPRIAQDTAAEVVEQAAETPVLRVNLPDATGQMVSTVIPPPGSTFVIGEDVYTVIQSGGGSVFVLGPTGPAVYVPGSSSVWTQITESIDNVLHNFDLGRTYDNEFQAAAETLAHSANPTDTELIAALTEAGYPVHLINNNLLDELDNALAAAEAKAAKDAATAAIPPNAVIPDAQIPVADTAEANAIFESLRMDPSENAITLHTDLSEITIDPNKGIAVHQPNPLPERPNFEEMASHQTALDTLAKQAEFYEKYGGQEGIPKLLGRTQEGGYIIDFVPGTPLDKFTGMLRPEEISQAIDLLKKQQQLTGLAHGDLFHDSLFNPGNVIIETLPDGTNVIHFIDYSGSAPRYFDQAKLPEYQILELQKLDELLNQYATPDLNPTPFRPTEAPIKPDPNMLGDSLYRIEVESGQTVDIYFNSRIDANGNPGMYLVIDNNVDEFIPLARGTEVTINGKVYIYGYVEGAPELWLKPNVPITPAQRTMAGILDAYDQYATRLQEAITLSTQGKTAMEQSFEILQKLAEEKGVKIQLIDDEFVEVIENGKKVSMQLMGDNSARISADGTILYVRQHPKLPNIPSNLQDVIHDVGAILTGGKIVPTGQVAYFTAEELASFGLSPAEIKRLIDPTTGRVPTTAVFDDLAEGRISRQSFTNVPPGALNAPIIPDTQPTFWQQWRGTIAFTSGAVIAGTVIITNFKAFVVNVINPILTIFHDMYEFLFPQPAVTPPIPGTATPGTPTQTQVPPTATQTQTPTLTPDSPTSIGLTIDNAPSDAAKIAIFLTKLANDFAATNPITYGQMTDDQRYAFGQEFYDYMVTSIQDSEFAYLLDSNTYDDFNTYLHQVANDYGRDYSYTDTSGQTHGVNQPINCVDWDMMLEAIPGLEMAHISSYSINPAGAIFGIINGYNPNNLIINDQGKIDNAVATGQPLPYNLGADEAYLFPNLSYIQPGDTFFYDSGSGDPGHTGVIIDVLIDPTTGGKIFIISESNSPNDGVYDGLPQTYIITEAEFESYVGSLQTTVFVRAGHDDTPDPYIPNSASPELTQAAQVANPDPTAPVNGSKTNASSKNDQPNPTDANAAILNAAQPIVGQCYPGRDGLMNACAGQYYDGVLLPDDYAGGPLPSPNPENFGADEDYDCTQLIIDSAETAGITGFENMYYSPTMQQEFANNGAYLPASTLINQEQLTQQVEPGMVVFVAHPNTPNTVTHVAIVQSVQTTTDGNIYVTVVQSSSATTATTYEVVNGQLVYRSGNTNNVVMGFGDFNQYAQNTNQ